MEMRGKRGNVGSLCRISNAYIEYSIVYIVYWDLQRRKPYCVRENLRTSLISNQMAELNCVRVEMKAPRFDIKRNEKIERGNIGTIWQSIMGQTLACPSKSPKILPLPISKSPPNTPVAHRRVPKFSGCSQSGCSIFSGCPQSGCACVKYSGCP